MRNLYRDILLSLFFLSFFMANAVNTFQNPDFAFPQTVQANAEAALKKAVASGNAPTAITALLQISTAKTKIDRGSLAEAIALADSTAALFKNSEYAPVFDLLTARLYYRYYRNNSWTFDRRELPLEPRPADVSEWSGDQFKAVIAELCARAAEGASARLRDVPLAKGDEFLTYDKLSAEFYPSLYDFVLEAATNLVASTQNNEEGLKFFRRYATRPDTRATEALWAFREAQLSPDTQAALKKNIDINNPYSSLSLKAYAAGLALPTSIHDDTEDILDVDGTALQQYTPQDKIAEIDSAVKLMREFVAKYPSLAFGEALQQQIERLCAPTVRVHSANLTAPLSELPLTVVNVNSTHYFINVFKLPAHITSGRDLKNYLERSAPVRRIEIRSEAGAKAPFREDTTLTVTLPEPGRYVIVPKQAGKKSYDSWYSRVQCVPVLPMAIDNVEKPAVIVSDPVTGAPVKGASVAMVYNKTQSAAVSTDADGVAYPDMKHDGRLRVTTKGVPFDFDDIYINGGRGAKPDKEPRYRMAVMTDRAIYHPGDSVQFLAVAHATQDRKQWLAKDHEVMFVLLDANNEEVDTLVGRSDEFGRAAGVFNLPSGGLTGQYGIYSFVDDVEVGQQMFTVADYRMPDFELRSVVVANDAPAKGDVTVRGEAFTYSGMPVGGCDVEIVLSTASRWRWFSPQEKVFSAKATTDDAGRFSAVIPDSVFKAHADDPYFVAALTASAPNGSTAEASAPVVKGKPYVINLAVEAAVDGEKPFKPEVEVFDPDGKAVTTPLVYEITSAKSKKPILSGEFTAEGIDIATLTPGEYTIKVKPVNKDIADAVDSSFTVYNRASGICPEGQQLFVIPGDNYIPADGRATVSFAVPSESYVHYAVATGSKIDRLDMIKVGAGYHDLTVDIPADADPAEIMLFMVKDVESVSRTIRLQRKADNELVIEGSSFRDNLLPGQPETWNFSIRPKGSDKGLQAALALDMYNKALDAIRPHSFNLSFPGLRTYVTANLRYIYTGVATNSYSTPLRFKDVPQLTVPQFRYGLDGIYIRGGAKMALNSRMMKTESVSEESVVYDMAAPAMSDGAALDEVVTVGYATMASAALTGSVSGIVPEDKTGYRDSDVPMALWAPMLTTDADGNVSVTFTVPNANTTWVLRGLAWSADMKVGSMMREFVASKPVMVQPNLPRFLRAGDEADIVASVMNNSDSTAQIDCVIEVFNPVTYALIDSKTEHLTLAAKASQTVTMPVTAPSDASAIAYRVRATSGRFSDGEQNVIQILPNEAQLIETTPFYLNPGDKTFSMRLPKEKGARISLTFCENPAWTVVSALPGLRTLDEESANSAEAALFSAAVARGIIKDNPAIGSAIRQWLDNPEDSTLVSMLERNEDLKIALLNATPWVAAGRSDSERMSQLAMIFNSKETDAAISRAIRTLEKLQREDGGWAWGPWMKESSKWVTMNILEGMAGLIEMGYFPKNDRLADMVESAVLYVDREVAAAYSDYKDYTDLHYAVLRPMFVGGPVNVALNRLGDKAVIDRTLNDITANWRSYSDPAYKAIAAMALYRNGRKATARLLTQSIAEFGVRSASQGVSFPSVNHLSSYACILKAFATIDPQSPMVDGIRQYLIVRKEATDWGSAVVTTEVVASILSTGSCWTVPAEGAAITVDGMDVTSTTEIERVTGFMEGDLSDFAGKELTITASPAGPSYGAVYAQFSRKMTDVKARAIDDLSIEKVLFVRQGTEWVEAPEVIPVGSRVKVQLTIHTKRNLDYVTIVDDRPAAFSPVDQIPGWMWSEGCGFYRENRNSFTALYVVSMRPGTYLLTYEMNVTLAGSFSSGVATIQSQYAPSLTAHSSASLFRSSAK